MNQHQSMGIAMCQVQVYIYIIYYIYFIYYINNIYIHYIYYIYTLYYIYILYIYYIIFIYILYIYYIIFIYIYTQRSGPKSPHDFRDWVPILAARLAIAVCRGTSFHWSFDCVVPATEKILGKAYSGLEHCW